MLFNYQACTADFFNWFEQTNRLHRLQDFSSKQSTTNYLPVAIPWNPQNQYFLYKDDEIGVCGSAVLSPTVSPLHVADLVLPVGTWMLHQTLFYIYAGHPIYRNMDHFDLLIEDFYLALFQNIWQASKDSHRTQALTLHDTWSAHDDLKTLGGYTFEVESRLMNVRHPGSCVGVIALTNQTYQRFQERKEDHTELLELTKRPSAEVVSFSKGHQKHA